MVDTFHKFIRNSISDMDLQIALDTNAERRIEARETAFSSLPRGLQVYRRDANRIRQDVIDNLDRYLKQFISRAEANGIIVHRAADAEQAVEILLNIAKESDCRLVAKSKTMVSEELDLNDALEAEGYRVVETDLGEYIIQLRGEPPAHIITPAVHLRKEQVAETFKEKLDMPYTEDIAAITLAARERLRKTFLEADLGISGVNFGVAESGSLCLVTNEGNGRMVTTLPRIHVALMGIERIVPSMSDLALMLELLPRSATGQKMTVYTTIINSPRKVNDPDGPEQRHLILVDNGRQAMRNSALAEGLLCIRCGACLNACPVFGEIGGHAFVNENGKTSTYPGPIGSIISPGLFGQEEFGRFARASTLCGACKDACPVDIDLPKLLLRVRAGGMTLNSINEKRVIPTKVELGIKLFTYMATNAKLFSSGLAFSGFLSKIISPRSGWLRMPVITGWGFSKDLRSPSTKPFRTRWAEGLAAEKPIFEPGKGIQEEARQIHDGTKQSARYENRSQKFSRELEILSGEFTLCKPGELGDKIIENLEKIGVSSILAWDDAKLPSGLLDDLRSHGIQVGYDFDPAIKVGLSGADMGIADTGTLVLALEPGKPQYVSLLPEFHFAVLKGNDIVDDLYQFLGSNEVKQVSMTTLISGPSRTADIEMTLTIGVHGPRQVHVFCLQD